MYILRIPLFLTALPVGDGLLRRDSNHIASLSESCKFPSPQSVASGADMKGTGDTGWKFEEYDSGLSGEDCLSDGIF